MAGNKDAQVKYKRKRKGKEKQAKDVVLEL